MELLIAPAKLTVSLRIKGRRADGMHLIDAEMVSLDLHDTLEVGHGDSLEIITSPGDTPIGIGDHNLVSRALRLCGRRAQVRVTKRVPAGAGLGGGSSDAAAILRWAGFDDLDAAAEIGADVAYCLVGGRARVRGIGEIVEPLSHEGRTYTLLTPPLSCSTPEVYRAWDELDGPRGDHGNDLEAAALAVAPSLARWRDELRELTDQQPRLAGSGSTWFVDGSFPGPGRVVTTTVPAH